ncbi:MAG: TonB-dependent copper receptor [Magnetococcales bacterium]|nr:TonB-dependent copper receptor [Magnetococcales bacterium]
MKKPLLLSAMGVLWVLPAWGTEKTDRLDLMVIEETRLGEPSRANLFMKERYKGPMSDGGDLLKSIPGIAGGRMGGHGMEPSIRGQNQNRINVLLDGSYVHGGCPNRMDPPSSYGTSETYDEIEIIKGSQSVVHGSGGSGGTVLFKRHTEPFTKESWYRGRINAGYQGNANVREGLVDLAVGSDQGFFRMIGNSSQGNDYEDGGGHTVRSSYKERTGNLIAGITPAPHSRAELGYEKTRAEDILFAGAGMDTPLTDHDAYRFKFEHAMTGSILRKLQGQVGYSTIDHLMDNYSLRTPTAASMYMRAPSTSDTWSGGTNIEVELGGIAATLGIDFQDNQRDAVRYRGTSTAVNAIQSYLWPDATLSDLGLFVETRLAVAETRQLILGLRYDHVDAEARKSNLTPNDTMGSVPKLSAAGLYSLYYGTGALDSTEHNVNGLIRLEQEVMNGAGSVYGSFSRSVRTADITERYIASNNNQSTASRWVGNPFLDPEQHHQLELGSRLQTGGWELDLNVYYNDVTDFILRDRDHNAHGGGNATIYRNVDATLYGGEASVKRHWTSQWSSGATLAHVRGENDSDNRPLAQIPPLEGALTTDFNHGGWNVGGKLRLAAQQTRVDDNATTGSGLDVGKTTGFQSLDLYGGYRFSNGVKLKLGINNLFDQEYAEHLNQASQFDTSQVQVNEPGRSFWLTAGVDF